MKNVKTAVLALVLSSISPLAHADSITDYRVAISSSADGSIEIRTTTVWNGDQPQNKKLLLHPKSIRDYDCDGKWQCTEEFKGGQRHSYLAFPKQKGWGYLLLEIVSGYESEQWENVWAVGTDGRRVALKDFRPSCQDFYWTKDGNRLIAIDGSSATAYDPETGKSLGPLPLENKKEWSLIVNRRCPTGGE